MNGAPWDAYLAVSCGGGRCYPGAGGASGVVAAGGLALLVLLVAWMWIAWQRRERARQVTRYEFNERGQLRPVPPRATAAETESDGRD